MNKERLFLQRKIFLIAVLSVVFITVGLLSIARSSEPTNFNGQRALEDIAFQLSLGPRVPGSQAHAAAVDWIAESLRASGWVVEIQEVESLGHNLRNITARRGEGSPWILLGAHYDSRILADRDPDPSNRLLPVPGANDGASGVAVLLELARVIPEDVEKEIWLVFFDAEDNGGIPGWEWILGSRAFAASLEASPDAVVIVDMVGDVDLNLPVDGNSESDLVSQIWAQAAQLGYAEVFVDKVKYHVLDDHIPFLELGIPAVDIIDLDYAYWHTRADTLDKVSAESLQIVGETLLAWLLADS